MRFTLWKEALINNTYEKHPWRCVGATFKVRTSSKVFAWDKCAHAALYAAESYLTFLTQLISLSLALLRVRFFWSPGLLDDDGYFYWTSTILIAQAPSLVRAMSCSPCWYPTLAWPRMLLTYPLSCCVISCHKTCAVSHLGQDSSLLKWTSTTLQRS